MGRPFRGGAERRTDELFYSMEIKQKQIWEIGHVDFWTLENQIGAVVFSKNNGTGVEAYFFETMHTIVKN